MKICVLGAGVIGLTTAWELAERGHGVSIIDRRPEPGLETSFANAGQLSFEYVTPLATPETLRRLPSLVFDREAPMRIRPSLDPAFLRWAAGFMAASTSARVRATTAAQLQLAALSRRVLDMLEASQALEFGRHTAGKLVLYRWRDSFEAARAKAGDAQRILGASECRNLEPGLRLAADAFAGGIYTASEQVGDCHAFCRELAGRLRRRNDVTWLMETTIHRPLVRGGTLGAVETSAGTIEADRFVLALGPDAPSFAGRVGLRLPIYPMKGYSITVEPSGRGPALSHSVTDYDRKMAVAPFTDGGRPVVRATGGADLVGFDRRLDAGRIERLKRHAGEMLHVDLEGDLRPWAGLRPATPDGRPIIGWAPLRNLFLNVGHGSLGWTLACGSGRLAAELIDEAPPSVPPRWFALRRSA